MAHVRDSLAAQVEYLVAATHGPESVWPSASWVLKQVICALRDNWPWGLSHYLFHLAGITDWWKY